ncbi:DUF7310 family coiled-coil domain-containing protein [Haloquadratum walsbyi]|uniref:DUF7310 domain-containing protein n=1 Tax=Haloquadratum walsbyi (strain DSM 16854 / JCM 12705 / C23) TaxID=768065 RepID=G0LGH8_HALWC|nr:hypothetical protein [Haloquadratum walsbyi]CCC39198.1 uncharacterized protein Hqrw_1235 [Haloquadratum walsbyi C23]
MDSADDALAARLDAVERAVSESTVTDTIDSTEVSSDHNSGVNLSSVPDLQAIDMSDTIDPESSNPDSTITEETSHPAHTNSDMSSSVSGEETPIETETKTKTKTGPEIMNRVGGIESRLNAITGELAAIRGLIESVSAVDEAVEQRANIALAKIEAVESRLEEDGTQDITTESETTQLNQQYKNQAPSSDRSSGVNPNQTATHDISTCATCEGMATHRPKAHDAVKQQSVPRSTAERDTPTRDQNNAESESRSHRNHNTSDQEDTAENHTDDSDETSLAARLRAAFE